MSTTLTVGIVQAGDMVWERRPAQQFRIVDGRLVPKVIPSNAMAATLQYFPHAAALLEAYVRRYKPPSLEVDFLPILYRKIPVQDAVHRFEGADVVGLSVYVWNEQYSLALARAIKERNPGVVVVLGGPQVPDSAEQYLRRHPFVDVVCHGEGERVFLEIIEAASTRRWDAIASTSSIDQEGRFVSGPRRERCMDLDQFPSPMLEGVYDRLMTAAPDEQWLATWETNRGCPFSCAFCDWGSATASKVAKYGDERLFAEIDWMVSRGVQHLFVCDANFGMLPRDVTIASRLADAYARRGQPVAISVQNTKNRTERSEKIQTIFRKSNVVTFGASVSMQSVSPTVLAAIKRDNISIDAFERLQQHYAQQGLDTYTDLIIGLPGETYDSFVQGVDRVIRGGQLNRIAFYECSVLPNAALASRAYRDTYALRTVRTTIMEAHAPLAADDGTVAEFIDLIVSTSTMDERDWVRSRLFAYLVDLLFFDRVLHVPLVLLCICGGVSFSSAIEAFLDCDESTAPVTAALVGTLRQHVERQLAGGPQFMPAPQWLGLWWPADQYALLDLASGSRLEAFYAEARRLLAGVAAVTAPEVDAVLIDDAVSLNEAMFALPFQLLDDAVETAYPVGDDYLDVLAGDWHGLSPRRPSSYVVSHGETVWMSWHDWTEDLVRRVYLRKYYLSPVRRSTPRTSEGGAVRDVRLPAARGPEHALGR